MTTLEKILKLGEMGYKKDDISALLGKKDAEKKDVERKDTERKDVERKDVENEPPEYFKTLNASIEKLTQTMQAFGLRQEQEEPPSVDEILANIINPKE